MVTCRHIHAKRYAVAGDEQQTGGFVVGGVDHDYYDAR